ncbi:MAG TPA: PAS domain-containing protein [Polyangia bacterium]|jgi:DNA-binding CsgD family transcriptional regulator
MDGTIARTVLESLSQGILLVDGARRVRYLNAAARAVLASRPAADRLAAEVDAGWHGRAQGELRLGDRVVRWRAEVIRAEAGDLLLVELSQKVARQRDLIEALAARFVLTHVEARLLIELARSRGNRELAGTRGISVAALKSRLHRVYRKLGVTTRVGALAALAHLERELGGAATLEGEGAA